MTSSWDLSLSIDAHGHDDTQVGVVPGFVGGSPHLKVRTGLVIVHCLDAAAAVTAGLAWASARLAGMTWLPPLNDTRRPHTETGAAYPMGSIYFEGRQPWHLELVDSSLSVTVGPLQVIAHDATALDTHIRAWTEASAVATRLFPGKAVPFARLVEHQRIAQLRALDREAERRGGKGRPNPLDPPPLPRQRVSRRSGAGPERGRTRD